MTISNRLARIRQLRLEQMTLREESDRKDKVQLELAAHLIEMARIEQGPEKERDLREVDAILWGSFTRPEKTLPVEWFPLLARVSCVRGAYEEALDLEMCIRPIIGQGPRSDAPKIERWLEDRYRLGVVFHEEAEHVLKAGKNDAALLLLTGRTLPNGEKVEGAFQHLANAAYRSPDRPWKADAQARANKIRDLLERQFGAKIRISGEEP